MADRLRDTQRGLRDYPISLRESARAVFGDSYASAERRGSDASGQDADRRKS